MTLYEDLKRIDRMMKEKGVYVEPTTGKEYFTGYEYTTLYDWDQYFEGIVMLYMGWGTKYMKNCVEIFLDLQREDGSIQRSSKADNWEQLTEHVKPFLAQITLLIYNRDGNIDFLTKDYYQRMKKYLLYWLVNKDTNGNHLSHWDSAPHTGMDNQKERAGNWLTCRCEGVDLNAYLVRECKAFALIAELFGEKEDQALFLDYAEKITEAMQKFMWNEEDGLFYDLDRFTGEQIKVSYVGIFSVLWAEIATKEQAERLVKEHLLNEKRYYVGFMFPALSKSEPGYKEGYLEGDLGCCWRANTWIPTNYYIFKGLKKYGYLEFASQVARETYENVKNIGDREYYTTESRQGCGLNPFWGWSLLAYFMPMEDMMDFDITEIQMERNQVTFI